MRYLSIKNYAKHQHYKDRRPPWIKLHAEVLDDYEFLCLQDASKAHLMLLWVLASKLENRIPCDPVFLAERLGATTPVNFQELVLQGFIELSEDDSKPLAFRKQSAMPETEAEGETEKKLLSPASGAKRAPNGVPHPMSSGWPAEGAEIWSREVGPIEAPRFGKAVKKVVDRYGWPETKAALECYIELKEGSLRKAEYFAGEAVTWIRLGKMPLVDPNSGALTERGQMAHKIIQRLL